MPVSRRFLDKAKRPFIIEARPPCCCRNHDAERNVSVTYKKPSILRGVVLKRDGKNATDKSNASPRQVANLSTTLARASSSSDYLSITCTQPFKLVFDDASTGEQRRSRQFGKSDLPLRLFLAKFKIEVCVEISEGKERLTKFLYRCSPCVILCQFLKYNTLNDCVTIDIYYCQI